MIVLRNDNLKLGKYLAQKFDKSIGVITYSGTLALELALIDCNFSKNTGVIVSSEVCSSIINTIIKLDLIPLIIYPQKDMILTNEEVDRVLQQYQVGCILLVHQFGLVNNISKIKHNYPHIKIIEDIAQSWDISQKNYKVGNYSDYIVTSFGKTKPLSYGIGGAIMTNNESILDKIDFCDSISRESKNVLYSYAYPLCDKINIKKLINNADKIVNNQRKVAKYYMDLFKDNKNIYFIQNNHLNTWHRFPIWIKDDQYFNCFLKLLDTCEIKYQLPHKIEIGSLPMVKTKAIIINNCKIKSNIILLRTRVSNTNYKSKISKLKKLMINN